jgi:hypothetical protein
MRRVLLLIPSLLICACSTSRQPTPPPPPPVVVEEPAPPPPAPAQAPPPPTPAPLPSVTQVGAPSGGFKEIENAQVGRAYLVGDEVYKPTKDNLPFGVILLRPGDNDRNRALCNSFVNNISTVEDIRAADASINIIATYWMLSSQLSPSDLANCDRLLENYNYGRAQRILAGYGKASSTGPVFLALRLNRDAGVPADVFLLDLSDETPANVSQITIKWFDVVVGQSDDEAANLAAAAAPAAPGAPPAAATDRKGRGFFRKVLSAISTVAAPLSCDILTGAKPDADVKYSKVEYLDPFLNDVRGTLQVVTRSNVMVSFAAELLGMMLCPSSGPGEQELHLSRAVNRDLRVAGRYGGVHAADRRQHRSAALVLGTSAAAMAPAARKHD